MYGALWRVLPGPVWLKIVLVLILATGVFFALMMWFYPEVMSPLMPFNDGTVTSPNSTSSGGS